MKSAITILLLPLLLLLLLLLTCTTIPPFTSLNTATASEVIPVPIFCNEYNFTNTATSLETKSRLLTTLIANTYSNPHYKYCTRGRGDGHEGPTMYGYAYCVGMMKCDDGNKGRQCPTSYEQCSACLATAGKYLTDGCEFSIGAHVTVRTERLECYMRYESRKFCLLG